jgi:hypothetical protein
VTAWPRRYGAFLKRSTEGGAVRLPFIQIKQDAFTRAKMLGGYLRTTRREAMGLQADLWAWGVELTPEDCPEELIGVCLDSDPAGMLAAALEWRDGPDHLLASFVRAGFIEIIEGGIRIKGLREVYAAALSIPGKRSAAGKIGAASRWQTHGKPDGKAMASDGQTQTQTQTQTQIEKTGVGRADPIAAMSALSVQAVALGAAPGRRAEDHPSAETLREALERAWLQEKGAAYVWRSADDNALRPVLVAANNDAALIEKVWRKALKTGFPKCLSVGSLGQHWNAYAGSDPPERASLRVANIHKSPIRAEDIPRESFAKAGRADDF